MRRRKLSDEELNNVMGLRQVGASWLKIQHETGIHRQTAKRAYERWEHSKSMEELKEARRDVAAQAFREHVDSLVTLAASLVTNLSVPSSIDGVERNSKEFFLGLWASDLLGRHQSPKGIIDYQSYFREQELLFEALQVHTREVVRWVEVLDNRWRKARDMCSAMVGKIRKETGEAVNNFLKQEREGNFLQRIKEETQEQDPLKQIVETILKAIWRLILRDELGQEVPFFETPSQRRGGIPDSIEILVMSRHGEGRVLTFIGDTNKKLAEKVTKICNSVADALCKGDSVQDLHHEVGNMKKASDELREALNPVKLRPMIIRTRCDLCPA